MIHPNTALKFISENIGYGVFATSFIPKGTIVYVKDSLESVISPADYLKHNKAVQDVIEKYSYIDEKGNRIVSWDFAKYVNHCCNCNSISTGYGFEIAIRDIQKGEQITDEYGIFNLEQEMSLTCGESCCRKSIGPKDFDKYYQEWDLKIQDAMLHLFDVEQALNDFLEEDIRTELSMLAAKPHLYKSIYHLKYVKVD